MTFRDGVAVTALLAMAACTSPPKPSNETQAQRFSTLAFAADPAAPAVAASQIATDPNGYAVEVAFERADGSRRAAPAVIVKPGHEGSIALMAPSEFQPDAAGGATPPFEDGVRVQVCAQKAGDGGVAVAYSARMTKITGAPLETATAPPQDVVEFSGARWLEPGVRGMLARIPSPDGSGQMLVLARVTPVRVEWRADEEFASPGSRSDTNSASGLARAMSGRTVHLRVSAVRVGRDFTPGAVIDETATPDVLKLSGGEVLRDFEAYTCVDGRVRLLGTSGSASFAATFDDDGRVTITWNGRKASVRANEGRRFVSLAPIEGGGTAGVIVSVNADD